MTVSTFNDLQLAEPIQRAIRAENYTVPTPIQAQAIPHLLKGRDLLGSAQTGTGKTAAFALPILHRLESQRRPAVSGAPRGLVLSPTRELALQISESFQTYGQFVRFRQTVVYGGVHQNAQVRALNRGVHLVVATPGRLIDLMDQGHIRLDELQVFVLDEADRMLDMGFLPALHRIISELPEERQSLFFSATLPPKIVHLAQNLLQDPVRVDVVPKSPSVEKIEQRVLFLDHAAKRATLESLLKEDHVERALVFTKTKRTANVLAEKLAAKGIKAAAIHGNKSQAARQRALEAFRRKQVQVLVATDVAARGIDIDGITHVINYDLPMEPENYMHRIGRTGRAGAEGMALSFCTPAERDELRAIERLIGKKIPLAEGSPEPVPVHAERSPSDQRPADYRKPKRSWAKGQSSANASGQSAPWKRKRKPRPAGSRLKSKG